MTNCGQKTVTSILLAAAIIASIASVARAADDAGQPRRPNIIVILADDLGYADVGFHGGKDIATPYIDRLADQGVRCTNAYVSAPVCSPTRAGLMTGRYQQRFGHEFNPGPPDSAHAGFGLPKTEITMPEQLKKLGYVTGMVGKWHLGLEDGALPTDRGFDEFFGFPHGSHPYFNLKTSQRNPIMRGEQRITEEAYLTDAFNREAVAFIKKHEKEPFFLYLSYNAVHGPLQAPQKYLDRFPSIKDRRRRTYAAMLSAMDDGVGQVMATLRELQLDDDTLIFFLSDNGGPPQANASSNTPLRGKKGDVLEGGIRVPFVVWWKDHLPNGAVYDQPVISLDIFTTAVAVASGQPIRSSRWDGVNLLPYLTGKLKTTPHEHLFWRFGTQRAIRRGDLKLVWQDDGPWHLYDLSRDISESHDLAEERFDVAKSLAQAYEKWNSQLEKPRWRGRGERSRLGARGK